MLAIKPHLKWRKNETRFFLTLNTSPGMMSRRLFHLKHNIVHNARTVISRCRMAGVKLKSITFFSDTTEDGCLSEKLWLHNYPKLKKTSSATPRQARQGVRVQTDSSSHQHSHRCSLTIRTRKRPVAARQQPC